MVIFSKILRQHPLAMHSTGVKIRSCKLIFKGLPPSLNIPTYLQVLIHQLNKERNGDWWVVFYSQIYSFSLLTYYRMIISSVRSSSGYHGLIEIRSAAAAAPTFSDFSNSSDSKVKVKVKGPNMCYIFVKHGIQGYRI